MNKADEEMALRIKMEVDSLPGLVVCDATTGHTVQRGDKWYQEYARRLRSELAQRGEAVAYMLRWKKDGSLYGIYEEPLGLDSFEERECIVVPLYTHPQPEQAAPRQEGAAQDGVSVPREPTEAMVAAYLKAITEYWEVTDTLLPQPPAKWRAGTPYGAFKEGYRAMLSARPQQGE